MELTAELVTDRAGFESALAAGAFDLVLSGYTLPAWTGMDALTRMRECGIDLPFILVTGSLDTDAAVACVRQGASDYVLKGHLGRLPQAVAQALNERKLREERRQARRLLAESERRFRCLTLATSELVWIADHAGRMSGRLARWQSYTGQSQGQIAGHGWLEALHPEDRASARGVLDRAIAAADGFELEVRLRRADGVYRRFVFRTVPVKGPAGELLEWIGSANDITDQVGTLRALRESAQRYRALTESTFDGVVITEHGMIVEANPGFAALFGATTEALLHTRFLDLVEPAARATVQARMESGAPQSYSFPARARDDRRLEVEALTRASVAEGRQVLLTALRDQTAHRELERQFLHAQRLEAVGQLAGGIAHDFNNILTSVLGFSQFLIDQLPEESPHREDAREIYRAGELAALLTRKLLAFSRRQAIRPEVLDLNRVIEGGSRMLGRLLGEDIKLELATRARPALVSADPGQLEQVLLNLAVNARDAMPQGGLLRIRTAVADLGAGLLHAGGVVPPGRYVQLTVADEGIGMSPEVLDRIFEPFFTTKGGSRGSGLGLSTVYGIIQQAAGHIVVQTATGRGTSFDLYFPMAQAEAGGVTVQRPLGAAWGDETILVVEDQPAIRSLAQRVLARAGYSVLLAESGDAARSVARNASRLHLIVMDVLLPGERGPRVAAELREQHPEARVLFISGNSGVDDEPSLPEGPYWFLQKPFTPDQFLATVRSALDAPIASALDSGAGRGGRAV